MLPIAVDYSYTLHDMMKFAFSGDNDYNSAFDRTPTEWIHDFVTICEDIMTTETYAESAYITTEYFKELFYVGILAPHYENIVGRITKFYPPYISESAIEENEPDEDEVDKYVYIPFVNAILQTYAQTAPKYIAMIEALNSLEAETDGLLKRPSSTSTNINKYSDTPQDENNEAVLTNNAHLTNVTRNESEVESDGASPVARFGEIAEKYRNIYQEWAREFDPIFIRNRGTR